MAKQIMAKYSGKCACGGTIGSGDQILFDGKVVGCVACKPGAFKYDLSIRAWGNAPVHTSSSQAARGHARHIATLILSIERWTRAVAAATDPTKRARYEASLVRSQNELPAYRATIAKLPKREQPSDADVENALRTARAEQAKRDAERAEESAA